MDFVKMYNEMLHNEFGSGGASPAADAVPAAAAAAAAAPAAVTDATPASDATAWRGAHAAMEEAPPTGVDTLSAGGAFAVFAAPAHASNAPTPIHRAFGTHGKHVAKEVPAEREGPTGLSRYRNAAMVGAGGLTCAAVGAFLGGLGGYFTVDPAAAHPVATAAGQNQQLAAAVGQAYTAASHGGGTADDAASFSSLSGGLVNGIDPLQWLTSSGSDNLVVSGVPGLLSNFPGLGGAGLGSGGSGLSGGLGCTSSSDLGVACIVSSITSVMGDLGSSGSAAGTVEELLPSLNGVVIDVTGTLSDLGTLLPISSVPSAGLPTSVLDELGLGSILGSATGSGVGLGSLGSLGSLGTLGSLGSGSVGTLPGSTAGVLDPVLNGILAAAGAAAGSGSTSLPSLPLPSSGSSSGLPSLPVSVPSGSVSSTSTVGSSTTTTSTSTTTTTQPSSGTTVTAPLPTLPLPSTPPASVGGVSVGVNSSSAGSGLSLSLP